jgi:hypothetical protein
VPKRKVTADASREAGSNFRAPRIAIMPIGGGNWSALMNATERRNYPDLANAVGTSRNSREFDSICRKADFTSGVASTARRSNLLLGFLPEGDRWQKGSQRRSGRSFFASA